MSQTQLEDRLSSALTHLPEGVNRRVVCPLCGPHRKHKGERTLSLKRDGDTVLWNCWHCHESGNYVQKQPKTRAIEKQPEPQVPDRQFWTWLSKRGISPETAQRFGVFQTTHFFHKAKGNAPAIGFPYTNQGQTYASKLRCLSQKDFIQIGSAQSFFGLDQIGDLDRVIICEGEMDALSFAEVGVENAISVPNGAPDRPMQQVDPNEDRKFRYIWDAKDILEQVDAVYIAADDDRPGALLMDEIARRVGKDKCWKVEWPEGCKDANEVLMKKGRKALKECVENAVRFPVAGLYEAEEFKAEVFELYKDGKGKGFSTGYLRVDDIYTVVPGHLSVVTGIPSSGKSEFIDQLMVNLANRYDWTFAICSFENEPRYHVAKLMQKKTGKHFFPGPSGRMGTPEAEASFKWVGEHFFFLHQADGSMSDIDSIIERLKVAVVRHGVRAAVIDPYNYIERNRDDTETQWISEMLTKVRLFAQAHEIHIWFVAHPASMRNRRDGKKISPPDGYDISGSAAWFAKADMGITVHRDMDEPELVKIINWKSRFAWAGKQGEQEIVYDKLTTTYTDHTDTGLPWDD